MQSRIIATFHSSAPASARQGDWVPGRLLVFILAVLFIPGAWAQSPSLEIQKLVREGQAALDAGDFGRAVNNFERAEQLAPENLEVNRGLLLSYLQAGRLGEAARIGEQATARWPRDAQLQHWLGLTYFKSR